MKSYNTKIIDNPSYWVARSTCEHYLPRYEEIQKQKIQPLLKGADEVKRYFEKQNKGGSNA